MQGEIGEFIICLQFRLVTLLVRYGRKHDNVGHRLPDVVTYEAEV